MMMRERLPQYAYLMRLDKPIGVLLLLWPTLWALWLASGGEPDTKIVSIFILGVMLMRAAGCVINDFADRHVDAYVKRTQDRPLAAKKITSLEALLLFVFLIVAAFLLVLTCNRMTIGFAFIGAGFATLYPFLKRYTHLPQIGLGVAFAWSVPMAFAAETAAVSTGGWFLFLTVIIWTVIYDTMYAMVDREDDVKIGIKSTAVLLSTMDTFIIGLLQILLLMLLIIVGIMFRLNMAYYFSLILVGALFIYQQYLIKNRDPKKCLQAFKNNNWVGLTIFAGIMLSYWQ